MKKTALTWLAAVLTVTGAFAQKVFFPTQEGVKLTYANMDDKGKVHSYSLQTVQKVEGSGDNMTIRSVSELLDKNRKPNKNPVEVSHTIVIKDGLTEMDSKSFAASGTEHLVEIEGDKVRIPSSLAPGVKLDDANFTLTVNVGIKLRTEIALTEQACTAIEDITVTAGAFTCYKVTQTSAATIMRKTVVTKTLTWYVPDIGPVKTENYNDKGKLTSIIELYSIEK